MVNHKPPCAAALKSPTGSLYKECKAATTWGFSEACMPACARSGTLTALLDYAEGRDGDKQKEHDVAAGKACNPENKDPPRKQISTWCYKGFSYAYEATVEQVVKSRKEALLQGRTVEEVLATEKALKDMPARVERAARAVERAEKEGEALKAAGDAMKKKLRGGPTEEEVKNMKELEERVKEAEVEKAEAAKLLEESEEAKRKEEERERKKKGAA